LRDWIGPVEKFVSKGHHNLSITIKRTTTTTTMANNTSPNMNTKDEEEDDTNTHNSEQNVDTSLYSSSRVSAVNNNDESEKKVRDKIQGCADTSNRPPSDNDIESSMASVTKSFDTCEQAVPHTGKKVVEDSVVDDKIIKDEILKLNKDTGNDFPSKVDYSNEKDDKKSKLDEYEKAYIDPENIGLAVAMPVIEDYSDDEMFLPAAVEFDPDKKSSEIEATQSTMRRKVIIGTLLVIVIVTSIAVGVIIGTKKDKVLDVPDHPRLQVGIQQFLEVNFPSDSYKFQDPVDPLTKAMNWMTYDDPQQLVPSQNSTFLQRFILVHLYYQTTQQNDWEYCYPNVTTATTDNTTSSETQSKRKPRCQLSSYSKFSGVDPGIESPKLWLSKQDECDWAGNKCDDQGHIEVISLSKFYS
jgi:hypothetical protein